MDVIAFLWETPQFILGNLITVIGTWSRLAPVKHFKIGLFTLFSVKPGKRRASQTRAPSRALIAMLASQNRTANSGRYGAVLIYKEDNRCMSSLLVSRQSWFAGWSGVR